MFQQFLREEEGQTTVEYLLIIAVIVVVISVLGKGMKEKIGELTNNIFKGVNSKVQQLMSAASQ
jgi:Flp pilus assembly pilin Flp